VPDGWTCTGAAVICAAILLLLRAGTRAPPRVAVLGGER
jgi:hypothetical protein